MNLEIDTRRREPLRGSHPISGKAAKPKATNGQASQLLGPPDWRAKALCTKVDPEIFFPERGGSSQPAREVCARCEVRLECLEEALENNEQFGIWGNTSERERRRIRKEKGRRLREAS